MSRTPYVVFCPFGDHGKGVAWLFEFVEADGISSERNAGEALIWLTRGHDCGNPKEKHFVSVVLDPYEMDGT